MTLEDYIKNLAPELQEKARACGSFQELLTLAKQEKISVPDEALAAIAGGQDSEDVSCGHDPKCPKCGSANVESTYQFDYWKCKCLDCGFEWAN